MFGDGGVGIGWDDAGGGLAMWIEGGDGWELAGGQVDVTVGAEVDRGVSMAGSEAGGGTALRGEVEGGGCEVDVTAEVDVGREVAKAGGGKKSARGVGVLKQVPLMNLGIFDNPMTTEAIKGLT